MAIRVIEEPHTPLYWIQKDPDGDGRSRYNDRSTDRIDGLRFCCRTNSDFHSRCAGPAVSRTLKTGFEVPQSALKEPDGHIYTDHYRLAIRRRGSRAGPHCG